MGNSRKEVMMDLTRIAQRFDFKKVRGHPDRTELLQRFVGLFARAQEARVGSRRWDDLVRHIAYLDREVYAIIRPSGEPYDPTRFGEVS